MGNFTDPGSVNSQDSTSFTYAEQVPLFPESVHGTSSIDTQTALREMTEIRFSDDQSYRNSDSKLKEVLNLGVSTQYSGLPKRPITPNHDRSLSISQDLPMKSVQFQRLDGTELVPKEDQEQEFLTRRSQWTNIQSRSKRRTFLKRSLSYKNMIFKNAPRKSHLKSIVKKSDSDSRPACRKSKIYPRRYFQPSTSSSSDMVNDNNWSQILDEYISQRCYDKNVNLSTIAEFTRCWPPPPSYANITVDFHTPLISDPNSDNNHNIDTESETSSSFTVFEIENPVSDRGARHPRSYNLAKMPSTYPRSPPEYRPGSEPMFSLSESRVAQSPPQSQLFKDVSSMDASKSPSNNDVNMDDVGGAQSEGDSSPPRRPKYVYKPRDYSLRPREPWEFPDPFPLTPLQGLTAANQPDSSQRTFSTARVQNDTADDFRARRRRRRHIIDEEDYSDEDWDAQGEPRKILRLHYKEVKDNGDEWEPLTDEKARELMLKGRVDKYHNVKLSDTTGIELCKRRELEMYQRRKLENESRKNPSSSSSAQHSEPHNGSRANEGIESNTVAIGLPPTPRPKPSQGQRVRVNGKLITHEEKTAREKSSRELVVELRHLQLASMHIMEVLGQNRSSGDKTVREQKKRELQDIRDGAVSMEIPATEDDRQRAARIIFDIIDSNMRAIANGFGPDDVKNSSRWFSHDRFMNYNRLISALETESDQLEEQICILPRSSEGYKIMKSRLDFLQTEHEYLEKREDFYVDETNDGEQWCNDYENHNPPLITGDPRVNAEYGAAIGKWNSQASPQTLEEEEDDLQKAIRMSLGETKPVEPVREDSKGKHKQVRPRLILTMRKDNEGSAAQRCTPTHQSTKLATVMSSEAHWRDSTSLAQFQDDSMDETAAFEKAKAMSRAQYRNESPPPDDDDY
ncbi:uncharacterized protein Bfra_004082 [Botrytis fragariae]|uniref:Uncharacterized protein n=1 Tax=Botrytis fragariae TaxID=1964551 RepID=A0A8H6AV67_9HELO|nr:uncharacterized protein Bfra_004082 [Botrytis fragariae]KAF5874075.1 hypothetical protein Bfra_004082 [Botrytis fragariae]